MTQERRQINIHKSWDVNFWCEKLNLRADELKAIVRIVGADVREVRNYLSRHFLSRYFSPENHRS